MSFIPTSITKEETQHSVQYCWEALTCHAAYLSSLSSSFYPMHFVPNSRWEWKCLVLYFFIPFFSSSVGDRRCRIHSFSFLSFFWRARKRWKLLSSSFLLNISRCLEEGRAKKKLPVHFAPLFSSTVEILLLPPCLKVQDRESWARKISGKRVKHPRKSFFWKADITQHGRNWKIYFLTAERRFVIWPA